MVVFCLFCFLLVMMVSIVSDLVWMRIPNLLILALISLFFLMAFSLEWPLIQVASHVVAASVVLVFCFFAFSIGWMGGGDAKLIAATALWFGPTVEIVHYLLLFTILGGILTLLVLLARSFFLPVTGYVSIDRILDRNGGVPYGVALGAAGLWVFASSGELASLQSLI